MTKKVKNVVVTIICALWIFGLSAWGIFAPDADISVSERRKLAAFPTASKETLLDGSFMSDFEKYSADQFPLRESFRRIKSIGEFYLFRRLDSNKIYLSDGFAALLDYPLDLDSIDHAAKIFNDLNETYFEGRADNVYLSVVPDKNYYLAEEGGYLHADGDELISLLREKTPFAEYIDLTGALDVDCYYKTDTHWRQEKILPAAAALAEGLGVTLTDEYTEKTLDKPFYGVYYGQSALPMSAEEIKYLESERLSEVKVFNYETNAYGPMYDLSRAEGLDPYEIYLSGPRSLITLENPNASTDRELIIFRDSFGSSIAPLLAEAYKKITLVDVRYLPSKRVGYFVDFDGSDVLLLYSTLILNSSETLK